MDQITKLRPKYINERFIRSIVKVSKYAESISSIALRNMKKLLDNVDIEYYSSDNNLYSLLITAEVVLDCKLKMIDSSDTMILKINGILSDAFQETKDDIIYPLLTGDQYVNKEEEIYINNAVSLYLRTSEIELMREEIIDRLTIFSSGSTINMEKNLTELANLIRDLNAKLLNAATPDADDTTLVQLSTSLFKEKFLLESFERASNPDKVLKMGVKRFNEMLSPEGGLKFSSLYMFAGPTAAFKSSWMMYMAKWIQKYNGDTYRAEFERTGIRPVIVYISLENNYLENSSRFFSMVTGKAMETFASGEEVQAAWDKYYDEIDSCIDVIFYHGKAGKFSVESMYQLKEDLIERGMKVITWFVDYLKILKPDGTAIDKRIQINEIAKDMHSFIKDEPDSLMITVHHTNRNASIKLSEMDDKASLNKIKGLGHEHMSEAHGVVEALDWQGFIGLEVSPYDNKTYVTVSRGKCRWKATDVDYFAIPLDDYFIHDDIHLPEGQHNSVPMIAANNVGGELGFGPTIGRRGETDLRNVRQQQPIKSITYELSAGQKAYNAKLKFLSVAKRTQMADYYLDYTKLDNTFIPTSQLDKEWDDIDSITRWYSVDDIIKTAV